MIIKDGENSLGIMQGKEVHFIKGRKGYLGRLAKVERDPIGEVYYVTVEGICHPIRGNDITGHEGTPCYCEDIYDSFVQSHGVCRYCYHTD